MSETALYHGLVRLMASTVVLSQKALFSAWQIRRADGARLRRLLLEDRHFLEASNETFFSQCVILECELPLVFADYVRLSSVQEHGHLPDHSLAPALSADHLQIRDDMNFVLSVAPLEGEPAFAQLLIDEAARHDDWAHRWLDAQRLIEIRH